MQYLGLQILEKLIQTKWKTLPEAQRQGGGLIFPAFPSHSLFQGIRNFIVGIIMRTASDETTTRREKTYMNKLNLILVQVRPTPGL